MATVRMIVSITGTRNGDDWPLAGGTIDLPEAEAADLVNAGLAVRAESAMVEKAVAPAAETAAPRKRAAKATAPKAETR